jgi:hypothetical protein
MSSDEEDLDLNDEATSQLETITDDGGEIMDIEGKIVLRGPIFQVPPHNTL